jgi:hypothetical protein
VRVADTLRFLLGEWQVQRAIEDRVLMSSGVFEGSAALVPSVAKSTPPSQALYEEVGNLHLGSFAGEARRRLRYVDLDGETVMLYLVSGIAFADLNLSTGSWKAIHQCGEDLQEITTSVISRDVVEEQWKVRGPSVHYRVMTVLTRLNLPSESVDAVFE